MKSLNFIIGILVVFGLFSCNSNTNNLIGEDSSKNFLDWAGSYWGIIPCENCPGIEMELKINSDETFIFTKNYLEKENSETIIEVAVEALRLSADWAMEKDGIVIGWVISSLITELMPCDSLPMTIMASFVNASLYMFFPPSTIVP